MYEQDDRSSSPLPDFVPNTIPEELTIAPDGAGSRQAERDVLDIDAGDHDIVMAPPRKVSVLLCC
jgi:hypothetical protein